MLRVSQLVLIMSALALPALAQAEVGAARGANPPQNPGGHQHKARGSRQNLVAENPGSLEAQMLFQDLMRGANRQQEIGARYADAAKARPEDPVARFLYARTLRGPRAVAEFTAATTLNPEFAHAWVGLARALEAEGKLPEAEAAARRALAIDPNLREAHDALGWVLEHAGNPAGAEEAYRAALAIDEGFLPACFNLAVLLARRDKGGEGLSLIRKARKTAPGDPQTFVHEGLVLGMMGRAKDAAKAYEKAVALAPKDLLVLVLLGESYAEVAEWALAKRAIDSALALDSKYAPAHAARGYAALLQGLPDAAIGAYATASKLRPDNASYLYYLGLACERKGDHKQALVHYKNACEKDTRSAVYRLAYGSALEGRGKTKEALAVYKEVTLLEPENPDAWIRYGDANADLRKPKVALEAYLKAKSLDPKNLGLLKTLGILYETDLNDPTAAIECYQEYLANGGTDKRVSDWIADLQAGK